MAVVSIIGFLIAPITALSKTKVAVIDTGLNINSPKYQPYLCKSGHKDFTFSSLNDTNGHGTTVVDLIIENAKDKDFCLVIYKFYKDNAGYKNIIFYAAALEEVNKTKPDIVNMSLAGPEENEIEKTILKQNVKTLFVVAAGNDNVNIGVDKRFPASYDFNNMIVVGAKDKNGVKLRTSNYGTPVDVWEESNCTSFATAIKTGKSIKQWQK